MLVFDQAFLFSDQILIPKPASSHRERELIRICMWSKINDLLKL